MNWERNESVHEVILFTSFTEKICPFERQVQDWHNTSLDKFLGASATVTCHCQVAYQSLNGPNLKCSRIELLLRISELIALIFITR